MLRFPTTPSTNTLTPIPYKPALVYHVQSRLFDFIGHGGIEHLEDAPEWQGR